MKQLSVKDLKRNPNVIMDKVLETDTAFLAGEDMSIIFPARWLEAAANLARIDITVSIMVYYVL